MAFGRLERNRSDAPMSDINMTPLIDVMLVLLVIFLITAPLLASSIRLELPRSDAGSATDGPRAVLVSIDREGRIYLDDQPVQAEDLAQRLARVASVNPDAEVQLRADATVPYGRVIEVIGTANKAGLARIGFVTQPGGQRR